jgi:flagellin
MALTVNTNVSALNAQRATTLSQNEMSQAMERLASGKRINSARDDAAGLAITARMQSQISGLNQAIRNANDAISLVQTAEGSLQQTTEILQRIRELSIQSAGGAPSNADRVNLQKEVEQLQEELSRIANTARFNGEQLLNGTFFDKTFQIGQTNNEEISVSIQDMRPERIGAFTQNTVTNVGNLSVGDRLADIDNGVKDQTLVVTVGDEIPRTVSIPRGTDARSISDALNNSGAMINTKPRTLTNVYVGGSDAFTLNLSSSGSPGVFDAVTVANSSDQTRALAAAINAGFPTHNIAATVMEDDSGNSFVQLVNEQGFDIAIDEFATSGSSTLDLNGDGTPELTGLPGTRAAYVGGGIVIDAPSSFYISSDDATNSILPGTRASLTVKDVTVDAATYTNKSFDVTVNGETATVNLEAPAPTELDGATTASIAMNFNAENVTRLESSAQLGGIRENTLDLSSDENQTKFAVSIDGTNYFDIDIGPEIVARNAADPNSYDISALTEDEFVSVTQSALTSRFEDKLTVSVTEQGLVEFDLRSDLAGPVTIREHSDVKHSTTSAPVPSSATVRVEGTFVAGEVLSFVLRDQNGGVEYLTTAALGAAPTSEDARDAIETALNARASTAYAIETVGTDGFTLSRADGKDFQLALDLTSTTHTNTAGVFSANTASVADVLVGDGVAFSNYTTNGSEAETLGPYDGLAQVLFGNATTSGSAALSTNTNETLAADQKLFGITDRVIVAGENDSLSVQLAGNVAATTVTIAAGTYRSMSELTFAVQNALDESGLFVGANEVTVSATQDSFEDWGITFTSPVGKQIDVSGSFISSRDALAIGAPPEVMQKVGSFGQQTIDLSESNSTKIAIGVGSDAPVDIDLADYITAQGWDNTALTADQFVEALQSEFDTSLPTLTASVDDNGRVTITSTDDNQTIVVREVSSLRNPQTVPAEASIMSLAYGDTGDISGSKFDFVLTDDDGAAVSVAYTAASDLTLTQVVAGLNTAAGSNSAYEFKVSASGTALEIERADGKGFSLTADTTYLLANSTLTGTVSSASAVLSANAITDETTNGEEAFTPVKANGLAEILTDTATSDLGDAMQSAVGSITLGVKQFEIETRTVTTGVNEVLVISLGDNGSSGPIQVAQGDYENMVDLAVAVQEAIDGAGWFTGDNAVTVKSVTDPYGYDGLIFENVGGKRVELSGTFLTDPGALNKSTLVASSETLVGAVPQSTLDLSANPTDTTFTITVQVGSGPTKNANIDIASYITARNTADPSTFQISALTAAEIEEAIEYTVNNAVDGNGNLVFGGTQREIDFNVGNDGKASFSLIGDIDGVITIAQTTANTADLADILEFTNGSTTNSVVSTAGETLTAGDVAFPMTPRVIVAGDSQKMVFEIPGVDPVEIEVPTATYTDMGTLAEAIQRQVNIALANGDSGLALSVDADTADNTHGVKFTGNEAASITLDVDVVATRVVALDIDDGSGSQTISYTILSNDTATEVASGLQLAADAAFGGTNQSPYVFVAKDDGVIVHHVDGTNFRISKDATNTADVTESVKDLALSTNGVRTDNGVNLTAKVPQIGIKGAIVESSDALNSSVPPSIFPDGSMFNAGAAATRSSVERGDLTGGVNMAGGRTVTFTVTDNVSGESDIRTVELSDLGGNASFEAFLVELEAQADATFADSQFGFVANLTEGEYGFSLETLGDFTLELSGSLITETFGSTVQATGTPPPEAPTFTSMDQVIDAINADLTEAGIDAVATFNQGTSSIVVSVTDGPSDSTSSVKLSGDDLVDLGFSGELTAIGGGTKPNETVRYVSQIDISTRDKALMAMTVVDAALETIAATRAGLGAVANRLESTIANLMIVSENTSASMSRIMDADFAAESSRLARAQVLQQASVAMLAQANASSQNVLKLLQ